jgi:hypothetical protein
MREQDSIEVDCHILEVTEMLMSSMKGIESFGFHEGMLMNVMLMSDTRGIVDAAGLGCYFLGDRMIYLRIV